MNDNSVLKELIQEFFPYAKKELGFSRPVRLFLRTDRENARNPIGRTAFYSPDNDSITIYTLNRHPKDVLKSLSHELVHHCQNCRGEFDNCSVQEGYAQSDPHMRKMEEEAYLRGSMLVRDWEDAKKGEIIND